MECSVYDATLTRLATISSFASLIWGEEYCGDGKLQLVVNTTDDMLALLQAGRFFGIPGHNTLMYIRGTQDAGDKLWVYGAEAKVLLKRRVYNGIIQCNNIEESSRTVMTGAAPYSIMGQAVSRGLTGRSTSRLTRPVVYTAITTWCASANYGFRMVHDKTAKKLLLDVYSGSDKTINKFSEKYNNVTNAKRVKSEVDWANVAVVAGSGEEADRVVITVGDTETAGMERSEIFVDARDLQPGSDETYEEYVEVLRTRGREKLLDRQRTDEITFDINGEGFATDYWLGDVVRRVMNSYSEYVDVRIIGYTETWEGNAYKLKITVGTPLIRRSF